MIEQSMLCECCYIYYQIFCISVSQVNPVVSHTEFSHLLFLDTWIRLMWYVVRELLRCFWQREFNLAYVSYMAHVSQDGLVDLPLLMCALSSSVNWWYFLRTLYNQEFKRYFRLCVCFRPFFGCWLSVCFAVILSIFGPCSLLHSSYIFPFGWITASSLLL